MGFTPPSIGGGPPQLVQQQRFPGAQGSVCPGVQSAPSGRPPSPGASPFFVSSRVVSPEVESETSEPDESLDVESLVDVSGFGVTGV